MNIYQKINELKKTIDKFKKDEKTEGKGAYTYTSGTQILTAIKSKMEELQLLMLPVSVKHRSSETFDYKTSQGYEKTDFIVQGEITYEWINAENPEERQRIEFQYYGQQNDISKAFGSGLTYSERYVLLKSLGIPTDEEDPDRRNEDKTRPTANEDEIVGGAYVLKGGKYPGETIQAVFEKDPEYCEFCAVNSKIPFMRENFKKCLRDNGHVLQIEL